MRIRFILDPYFFKEVVDIAHLNIVSNRKGKTEGFAKNADLTFSGRNGNG